MTFADPYVLNLLWALIPLFALLSIAIVRKKKLLDRFGSERMRQTLLPGLQLRRYWSGAFLTILAFALSFIALAGPQVGFRWEKSTQKGVDLMIALDCSRSMLATDVSPSRLERARREMIDLLGMLHSDRAGLVAFAGTAFLQCPLTLDHEAFHLFLNVLNPDYLPVGGSNLDAALQTCFAAFDQKADTQKAIIVITDGEDTSGDAEKTARRLAEAGVRIFAIGVGNPQGAPVPDKEGGFKKDPEGNLVLSKVDEKNLRRLADITGGTYVRSVAGDMDLDRLYTKEILGKMERKSLKEGKRKVWENRFQWLLFPAFLLLLVEFVLPVVSRKRMAVMAIFVGVTMGGTVDVVHAGSVFLEVKKGIEAYENGAFQAASDHFVAAQLKSPDDAALYYNIGAAAYKNGEYERAAENFAKAAESDNPELKKNAAFNQANSLYRLERFQDAVRTYEEVLESFPEDQQCRENLELAQKKLQEQQKNQDGEKPSGQDGENTSDKKGQQPGKQPKDGAGDPSSSPGPDEGRSDNKTKPSDKNNGKEDQAQDQATGDNASHQSPGSETKPPGAGKDGNDKTRTGSEKDTASPGTDHRVPETDAKEQAGASQKETPDPGSQGPKQAGAAGGVQANEDSAGETKASVAGNDAGDQGADGLPQSVIHQMEQMLNRLEDRPGKAFIHGRNNGEIEKDW